MKDFQYEGVNQSGGNVSGRLTATDKGAAIATLAERGHFVTLIHPANAEPEIKNRTALFAPSRRVSSRETLEILSQLSAALKAGLPLLSGLRTIREQQKKPATCDLLDELIADIQQGRSFSDAMRARPDCFRKLACAMVQVGEVGGILPDTMKRLVRILKREEKIKSNIKVALSYPTFVLCIGLASVTFILAFIMPRVLGALGDAILLPWPTRILLWMSDAIRGWGWLLAVALIAAFFLMRRGLQHHDIRMKIDGYMLRVPLLGQMIIAVSVGRFSRTLGALCKGGVSMIESLVVVRDTLDNRVLARKIDHVTEKVKTGDSLSGALASSGFFPPLLIQVTSMGEQTGDLADLLFDGADTFEEQADARIEKCMAILPGLLMVALFAVIGFIVLAVLLPIMGMDLTPTA